MDQICKSPVDRIISNNERQNVGQEEEKYCNVGSDFIKDELGLETDETYDCTELRRNSRQNFGIKPTRYQ